MSTEQELAGVLDGAAVARGMALGPNLARALARAGIEFLRGETENSVHDLAAVLQEAMEDYVPARGDTNRSEAEELAAAAIAAGWEHPGARCPNCDHPLHRHDDQGACWFRIDGPLCCPCASGPEKGDSESGASDD